MHKYIAILQDIIRILESHDIEGYIVGGVARNIMLGVHSIDMIEDIDIALSLSPLSCSKKKEYDILYAITKEVATKYRAKYTIYDMYYTSSLCILLESKQYFIDFALARKEIYLYPASKPQISLGEITF